MSVRFTSGGVGRFGFDEANATLDAADAMVGRFNDAGKPINPTQPKPIVARLTQNHGASSFHPGPKNAQYTVWSWSQVAVSIDGSKRRIAPAPNGKTAAKFGDMPSGRAVQLGGKAQVGETVVLSRLMSIDGEPWFCFNGRPDTPTGTSSVLEIIDALEIVPKRYKYTVKPVYMDGQGGFSQNPLFLQGFAFNLYELSDLHGQELEFDDPQSQLRIAGPVEGHVLGIVASAPDQPIVWAFEAPLPLTPVCGGPTPGAEGSFLRGGL